MRYLRLLPILVLITGTVFAAGCTGLSSSAKNFDETLVAQRLSQEDLRYFSDNLYDGTTKYIYRVYSKPKPQQSFSVVRAGVFEGALVMGHPSSRIPLFDGTTTDNRFNKIATRPLTLDGQTIGWGQQSSMPDGSIMHAFANEALDGRVSFAAILTPKQQLILILGEELVNAFPCMHEAAIGGSISAMGNCAASAGSSGSGAGGSGGGLFGGGIDLIGEPDCNEGSLGRVSMQGPRRAPRNGTRRVREIQEQMEAIREYQYRELRGNAEGNRVYERLSNALRNEQNANRDLAEAEGRLASAYQRSDIDGRTPASERAVRSAQANVRTQERAVERQERIRVEREDEVKEFERNRERNGGGGSGGGAAPVFGEQPAREDPRCEGRRVDGERGTLFTNEDFCQGVDPLTCLRRQQDSLYGLTEGQCWTETGPDDSQQIVCGKSERFGKGETLPSRPPPQDGSCPDDNFGCWTDPVAPRAPGGKIHLRYIDVMPLGGVLIGLCAAGGCEQFLSGRTP